MQDSLPGPLRKKNIFLSRTFYSVLLKCFISLNSSDCHPDRSDHPTTVVIHPERTDRTTNVIHPALSPRVGLMKHDLENTARKNFNYKKRCKRLNSHNTTWLLECRSSFFPIFLFKNSSNFREISVRILRSDMKNKGSDTAISWLCTGKKAMFKEEGNDVKISMFSGTTLLEQLPSNFCADGNTLKTLF